MNLWPVFRNEADLGYETSPRAIRAANLGHERRNEPDLGFESNLLVICAGQSYLSTVSRNEAEWLSDTNPVACRPGIKVAPNEAIRAWQLGVEARIEA